MSIVKIDHSLSEEGMEGVNLFLSWIFHFFDVYWTPDYAQNRGTIGFSSEKSK